MALPEGGLKFYKEGDADSDLYTDDTGQIWSYNKNSRNFAKQRGEFDPKMQDDYYSGESYEIEPNVTDDGETLSEDAYFQTSSDYVPGEVNQMDFDKFLEVHGQELINRQNQGLSSIEADLFIISLASVPFRTMSRFVKSGSEFINMAWNFVKNVDKKNQDHLKDMPKVVRDEFKKNKTLKSELDNIANEINKFKRKADHYAWVTDKNGTRIVPLDKGKKVIEVPTSTKIEVDKMVDRLNKSPINMPVNVKNLDMDYIIEPKEFNQSRNILLNMVNDDTRDTLFVDDFNVDNYNESVSNFANFEKIGFVKPQDKNIPLPGIPQVPERGNKDAMSENELRRLTEQFKNMDKGFLDEDDTPAAEQKSDTGVGKRYPRK